MAVSLPPLVGQADVLGLIGGAVLGLGSVGALVSVFLLIHHAGSTKIRTRHALQVRRATQYLSRYLVTGAHLMAAVNEARRRFGYSAVAEVLRRSKNELKGVRAADISLALADMGEVRRLARAFRSKRDWRRVAAIRGLGECGGDEPQQILLSALEDPVPEVRRAARDGLLADGRPESLKAAIRSYLEDSPRRSGWKRAFYARLASTAARELRELVDSGTLSTAEEKLGLEALGDARDVRVLPMVQARLGANDPEIRATAARVAGKLEDRASLSALMRLLDDPEWFVRAAAARAFESIPAGTEGIRALGRRLADEAWWVRSNSARALTHQGPLGVETLLDAVEGEDRYARDAALAALGLAGLLPAARRRLEEILSRLSQDPEAAAALAILRVTPEVAGV